MGVVTTFKIKNEYDLRQHILFCFVFYRRVDDRYLRTGPAPLPLLSPTQVSFYTSGLYFFIFIKLSTYDIFLYLFIHSLHTVCDIMTSYLSYAGLYNKVISQLFSVFIYILHVHRFFFYSVY